MDYRQMIADNVYDRFMELYEKRLYGSYMTKEGVEEYHDMLDKYLLGR